MSAMPEPGRHLYEGVEIGVDDIPEDLGEIFTVTVLASNPITDRDADHNIPRPSRVMINWLLVSNIDVSTVRMSLYEIRQHRLPQTESNIYFVVEIYFEHANDAMMFKMAFAGQ